MTIPPDVVVDDRSVSMERANVVALALAVPMVLLALGPFWMLWGGAELARGWDVVTRPWVLIPLTVLGIVVHEGLHALGFAWAGAPRGSIHFGVHRRTLSPFASCRVPLPARGYRIACALPALVLGVVPLVAGTAAGSGAPVVFALWMLLFAGGDVLILWLVRDLPADALVADHPTRAGCHVVAPERAAAHGAPTGSRPGSGD